MDEICISYDIRSRSIAFYNVDTKNRLRYSQGDYYNLVNVMKHIDERKPKIHWPRRCHPLRVFIENLRYLNGPSVSNMNGTQKETLLKGFWDNLWKQMGNA